MLGSSVQIGEIGGETWFVNPKVVAPVTDMLIVLAGASEVLVSMVESVKLGIEIGIVVGG